MWQFNLYTLPILGLCGLLSGYLITAWKWRQRPATNGYMRFTGCLLLFAFFYGLELSAVDVGTIHFFSTLSFAFGILSSPFALMFILAYTGHEHLLTRRNQLLLLAIPVAYIAFVWTDSLHHQYLHAVGRIEIDGLYYLDVELIPSTIFLLGLLTYLTMQISVVGLLIHAVRKAPRELRRQYIFCPAGHGPAVTATFVDISGANPFPYLDTYQLALLIATVPMSWALTRHRLLDIVPIAHDAIFNSIRDAVIILDQEDRIAEVNPAAALLIGKPAQHLLGMNYRQAFVSLPATMADLCSRNDASETVTIQVEDLSRTLDVRISPLRNRAGWLAGRVVVMRDITDSRRAEEQAVQLEMQRIQVQILQSFIQDVSHDLKTPITQIRASAYLLHKYLDHLAEQAPADLVSNIRALREKGDNIDQGAERLHNLIESMLQLARLDQEDAIQLHPSDLNTLIESLLPSYAAQAQEKGIALTAAPHPEPLTAALDAFQFQHVVGHLVRNAIAYTPSGGAVCIRANKDDRHAILEVHDTGIGISADDLPHIFERFYRADKARSLGMGGMGLGLAIAQRIVHGHGGVIQVESSSERGSVFRVRLPLAEAGVRDGFGVPGATSTTTRSA
ncbi:MAG: PAS domain-containing protein [Chloroflexi bacterium]|nr:PAS domain-containing protein [Chloroflexota bacterium]